MCLVLALILCVSAVKIIGILSENRTPVSGNISVVSYAGSAESHTVETVTATATIEPSNEEVSGNLTLVNSTHPLPEGFSVELTLLSNGKYVASEIYPDLQKMFDDMRAQGVYPVVGEGYRTREEQQQMLDDKIYAYENEGYSYNDAVNMAEKLVALPGTSEHELGLAVDINADETLCGNWDVYQWLAENAYKYGFILRYPDGKADITGIDYEPWHYRWVGAEASAEIYSQRLSLEEYLGAAS